MSSEEPTVIDLFSGCGGLSLGFQRAGFRILGGIELMRHPAAAHALNFFPGASPQQDNPHARPIDITEMPPDRYMREILDRADARDLVDVVAGGPPCQAFSRIGRAKLRDIMDHPEAHLQDGRADLYINFLEYVEYFRPRAVLMENVIDIINFGGRNVADEIAWSLDDLGYNVAYTILNAVYYGVPQYRLRFFLLGFRNDLNILPHFPAPSHDTDLPPGYNQLQQAVLNSVIQPSLFDRGRPHFVLPPEPVGDLTKAVTAEQALRDLPLIDISDIQTGPRTFDELQPYRSDVASSDFAVQMRTWPAFESANGVWDQVTRYLPRDHRIFEVMEHGDRYPAAHQAARDLFVAELNRIASETGHTIAEESLEYEDLQSTFVPPYDPDKFPDKWRKLHPDEPARTLTAHLGKDTYSHIHYDSSQKRVISVREAARLQSFPDGFQFTGGMGAAFRMIGNAVPPLLAAALAECIRSDLSQFKND